MLQCLGHEAVQVNRRRIGTKQLLSMQPTAIPAVGGNMAASEDRGSGDAAGEEWKVKWNFDLPFVTS